MLKTVSESTHIAVRRVLQAIDIPTFHEEKRGVEPLWGVGSSRSPLPP